MWAVCQSVSMQEDGLSRDFLHCNSVVYATSEMWLLLPYEFKAVSMISGLVFWKQSARKSVIIVLHRN
jgi:hypothetical protein